jgi:hypothetical protein
LHAETCVVHVSAARNIISWLLCMSTITSS